MKQKILPLLLCLPLLFSAFTLGALAEESEPYSGVIMEAYGGANGIVSMTFDDGDRATNTWLNQVFEEYDLYGSTMTIVKKNLNITETTDENGNTVYTPNAQLLDYWKNLYANGRLEPESHTYTHLVLPSDSWAQSNQDSTPDSLANNTPENYNKELVVSKQLIKDMLGYDAICIAPSNNTLSDGAMEVVKKNYYAVRQGKRTNGVYLQSLDPVPGSHEGGGWYNLWMHSFGVFDHKGIREIIPQAVDEAATNGGWLISLCHGIGESSGDAYYSEALPAFQKMSEYQKSGKLWVTTFGRATRYIRERQNSTVSYSYTENKVTVEVTMAEMTADGLPLSASVFSHPLTVRVELPLAVERVAYLLNGETETADTFLQDGRNYAYVNVVPNSGEVEISRISKGGIFSANDLVQALDKDGEYTVAGNISLGNLIDLTVDAKNVTIDLAGSTLTFQGENSFVIPEGANLTIKNGNIVIAHSYKGTANKTLRKYKPITQNEDGTYTLGSAVPIVDAGIITGDDLKQTLSSPAFSVTGGFVTLEGVALERSVAVSNGGELLSILSGGVTLQDSRLFESVGAESWASANTRLIYMERASTPTKLIVKNSDIYMAEPDSYYNGMLLCEDGPYAIDATTGAITNEKYTTDSGDNLQICYISGIAENTGVKIVIENSTIQARHSGFRSQTNYSSLDTFTMKNTRMLNTAKANYKEVGFELFSAELLFENCYLAMQDNIIYMNPYNDRYLGQGTTSLVMKQCYVTGTHAIRYPSVNNDIYLEDCYFDNGMMGWTGYDGNSEIAPPVIRVAGMFYTKAPIMDTPPVYGEGSWTSNSAKNYWINLEKTNETDQIVSGVPNWAFSVLHADGTASVVDAKSTTPYELKAGDVITVWNSYTTSPILVSAGASIPVRTYGMAICLSRVGTGEISLIDGKLGPISLIDENGIEAYFINVDANNFANTFSTLVTGQTLVLHADARVDAIARPGAGQKVAIDLNGYTLYHATAGETVARIEPMLGTEKTGDAIYIYSSREGGRLMNGYQEDKGGCILQTRGGGNIYVGFGPDGKPRGERISMYSSMMVRLNKGSAYFNNVDMYVIAGDNNSTFVYQDNGGGAREVRCYGCNIYQSSLPYLIYYRSIQDAKTYTLFENTNIYATSTNKKLIYYKAGPLVSVQDIVFRDANVYYMTMNTEEDAYQGKIRAVCEGECVMSAPLSENFTVAPGHSVETVNKTVTLSSVTYPFAALYGGEAKTNLNRSYTYQLVISPAKDYLGTLYTNVTLDTALDLHLYIPVDANLTSVKADGVELLDKEVKETIGTKEYYVVTISRAPKLATENVSLTITVANRTYYFEHSLLNYAKNLLSMDETKVSEASRAYLADSKEMMLYILNYAKEVITAYGEPANLVEINTLLGTFALTDADKVLENVKENLPTGTGVSVAFDLDSKVGFALGIANTFTGKVTVTLGEDTVSGEYTGDATANGDITNTLLLPNILAYRLYTADVTITVEGENAGVTVHTTFTYNLATYVNSGVSGNVGTALYAYAKMAKTYGGKYRVGTID